MLLSFLPFKSIKTITNFKDQKLFASTEKVWMKMMWTTKKKEEKNGGEGRGRREREGQRMKRQW